VGAKAHLPAQFLKRLRGERAPLGTGQCRQKPFGVCGGPQEMRGLEQATKFFGGDQGDIPGAAAVDDHHLTVGRDFVAKRRKIRTGVGIRRLDSMVRQKANTQIALELVCWLPNTS
jgi:hypothetical protein